MKKKLLSILMATALVASMTAGCGNSASTETKSETKAGTEAVTKEDTTKGSEDSSKGGEETDIGKIYLVSKGFQHQFWQAVLQGAEDAGKRIWRRN